MGEADTGIRVPGYPGYHEALFAPFFAFEWRRGMVDTGTRVTTYQVPYSLPSYPLSGGAVKGEEGVKAWVFISPLSMNHACQKKKAEEGKYVGCIRCGIE